MNQAQFKHWCSLFHHEDKLFTPPLIMGILNLTPDSFSDGGRYVDEEHAVNTGLDMLAQGADIIDIGGESSRPGSSPIGGEEELSRVIPIIKKLRAKTDACISVDTSKPEVMQAAIAAGANLINDISALAYKESLELVAQLNVPVCLMHMQGKPKTMQANPQYTNLIEEINCFFRQKINACLAAGIRLENLLLDPGFGFGKSTAHNLCIVKQLEQFRQHRLPILLGASRKSTLGVILGKPVDQRLMGGIVVAVFAALKGVAILRTHDVNETHQALKMVAAISSVS